MDAPPNAPSAFIFWVFHVIGTLAFLVVLIPILLIHVVRFCVPPWRVHPRWSLSRHIAVPLGRAYLKWTSRFTLPQAPGPSAWEGREIVRKLVAPEVQMTKVTIPALAERWRTGIASVGVDVVKGADVSGFWTYVPKAWTTGDTVATPGEKVILYVAGGSWVLGHPLETPFPYRMSLVGRRRVLSVNHRKAVTPESAFPAQLLDILAGYVYLLRLKFCPNNIALCGDSSGGHLILALSRYIADLMEAGRHDVEGSNIDLDLPGSVLLISPSCNLSHAPHDSISTDFLSPYLNRQVYPSLARHYPRDALYSNAYFSPAVCGSFQYLASAQGPMLADGESPDRGVNRGEEALDEALDQERRGNDVERSPRQLQAVAHKGTRVWIQYGDSELLAPDIRLLIDKMRKEGVTVDVDEVKGGCHLDAGIAFALRERDPESSWTRFMEAVKRY